MDESINNIYFLKETISKFKNEIQKFITDPQYANNNAVNIRHSLEDLEKKISHKEKNIAGQILNNNNPSYNPISSKYLSNKLSNNSINDFHDGIIPISTQGFVGKKFHFTKVFNNLTKSELLGNTSLSSNDKEIIKNSIHNFNNIYNYTNNININQSLNLTSPFSKNKSLIRLSSNSSNLKNLINNNRYEIQPDIKNVSENYYDLKYTTKRKAMSLENLESTSYNIMNQLQQENNDILLRKLNSKLTEESEKNYFKSTLMLRRINDEIHDKIQSVENKFKVNKQKQSLINKYDLSRKKLNKIKVKRSAGNINYMDRKKIQKFAFDKRSFFNSVSLDKNQIPIITPNEIERGLLAMINRGVIPKQADLTPAFNREGHPISLTAGEALREIYEKNNIKDEVQFENSKSLDKVKLSIHNKDKGFFLTAEQNNDTKNAVITIPKISLFNNVSKKNHKINDDEITDKDRIKELSEFADTLKHQENFIDNLNKSQESIERYNNANIIKDQKQNNMHNNENVSDLNANLSSDANKNYDENENDFTNKSKDNNAELLNINGNNKYSASYYRTENILHSKINLTKTNFTKSKDMKINENVNLTENIKYEKSLTDLSQRDFNKEISYTEINQEHLNVKELYDSDLMNNMENEMQKRIYFENNLSDTYTNTERIYILKFKNFSVIQNEDYNLFRNENEENWGKINYLINHIQKLFRKLNFTNEEVDTRKLLNLANDELANISNKDLILLMTDRLIKQRGFANKKILHLNLKEALIVRIQNYYRMYKAKKKYSKLKTYERKVIRIQRSYRLFNLKKIYQTLIDNKKRERLDSFRKLMDNFKRNWKSIKTGPRVEIHINSYGFNNHKNATFDKFNERQNNQLNRIINLKDPNVEIIYICPFEIGNEVLSYYFSILSTMGVENAKERFHLLIPVS